MTQLLANLSGNPNSPDKIDFSDPNWAQNYLAQYGTIGANVSPWGYGDASESSNIQGLTGYTRRNPDGTYNTYDPQGNLRAANQGEHSFLSDIGPGLALLGGGALGMNALAGAFGGGAAASGAGSALPEALGELGGYVAPATNAIEAAGGLVGLGGTADLTAAEIAAMNGGALGNTISSAGQTGNTLANATGNAGATIGSAAPETGLLSGPGVAGGATIAGTAPAVGGGLLSTLAGSGAGSLIAPLLGAALGSQPTTTSNEQQKKIDPRMDPYIYGDSGVLAKGKALYDANPTGITPQMQKGYDALTAIYSNPLNQQGYQGMQAQGQGLLGGPIAGNGTGGMMPQRQQIQPMQDATPDWLKRLQGRI